MQKIFALIFLSLFALNACGKKSSLEYPGEQKRPKFDKMIEEE